MFKVLRSQKALCSVTAFRGLDCCHLNVERPSRPILLKVWSSACGIIRGWDTGSMPLKKILSLLPLPVSLHFLGFRTQTRFLWSLFTTSCPDLLYVHTGLCDQELKPHFISFSVKEFCDSARKVTNSVGQGESGNRRIFNRRMTWNLCFDGSLYHDIINR